ncbi:mycofactocin biosynthesis peptidyl-dipeptidase MftE [Epidermidibacterium keratini]|uniref:Mycofactocin biosynthesis peptidyl-dipeptidase MftE n=1 Tax=Epidermidibacterium keratini TaxID=1891644 RepID=A0A7L4YTL3_9ACTN|nr:mycofactocin biosynthesis peptidyl-dipeptidase MftE [Epidermidibacterium keratini]
MHEAVWPEVSAGGTLVVPLGATEQHGPHLPLGTDTIIAESVAGELVRRVADAHLAPSIAIGASGEHAGFAGTLSIGTDAVYAVLLELVRHSVPPWDRVMVVNGHGGNATALARLADTCAYEKRPVVVRHCHVPGGDAHAGRTETSLLLHLRPELVRLDRAEPGNPAPVEKLLGQLREGGVRSVSPNGVLGDPTGASAAEGAELFKALVADALATYG